MYASSKEDRNRDKDRERHRDGGRDRRSERGKTVTSVSHSIVMTLVLVQPSVCYLLTIRVSGTLLSSARLVSEACVADERGSSSSRGSSSNRSVRSEGSDRSDRSHRDNWSERLSRGSRRDEPQTPQSRARGSQLISFLQMTKLSQWSG